MVFSSEQVQWGNSTLHLDNDAFRKGFLEARRWYFHDIYGEEGRPPEEPQRASNLTSEDVLRMIAIPDARGRYRLEIDEREDAAEYLGNLVGYLAGPLSPEEAKRYRNEQTQPTRKAS